MTGPRNRPRTDAERSADSCRRGRPRRAECKRGHRLEPDNLYIRPTGSKTRPPNSRECLACRALRSST